MLECNEGGRGGGETSATRARANGLRVLVQGGDDGDGDSRAARCVSEITAVLNISPNLREGTWCSMADAASRKEAKASRKRQKTDTFKQGTWTACMHYMQR